MSRTLLFYEKDEFYDYRDSKELENINIISISNIIINPDILVTIETEGNIIDLSVLTEYANIQFIGEQVVNKFPNSQVFICDIAKQEKIKYELRFVFDTFKNIDRRSLIIKRELSNHEIDTSKPLTKRHKKITDLTSQELEDFFEKFNKHLYGHNKFKRDFKEQVNTFRVFNRIGEHKILSLFLMGDSGVGKTEVARTIFSCLKGKKNFAKINFGNYSSEFSLSSLIGASRGYIGSEDGEIFMKIRDTDVGILLIDEFEKSNTALFNYFLNVLETGTIESSLGEQMDLNGFIIVFTSNFSREEFKEKISPELRSRFDYKCYFTLLSNDDKRRYITYRASSISKKIKCEFDIDIETKLNNYFSSIDVSNYVNMRDINKRIKIEFLKFIRQNKELEENMTRQESKVTQNNLIL